MTEVTQTQLTNYKSSKVKISKIQSQFRGECYESPSQEDPQPYDSPDYHGDTNELWQEIDEEGRLPSSYKPPQRKLLERSGICRHN